MNHAAWVRPTVGLVAAVLAGLVTVRFLAFEIAMSLSWIVFAAVYIGWTGLVVARMSPGDTRTHATREDPSRSAAATVLLIASLASIGGVALLLTAGSKGSGSVVEALFGVLTVASSWLLVHTIYTLHYARLYYGPQLGLQPVDFNDDPSAPDYHDFAYLAFTLGMTYQVSDTGLKTKQIRRAALRHALMSYLLGAIVVACTVNLVAQIASGPASGG